MKNKAYVISLILILFFFLVSCSETDNKKLRIGVNSFGSIHNPYYYQTSEEKNIIDFVVDRLFSSGDENSIATLTKRTNEYIINVNEGIISADGVVELTYKDVLFDLYFLLDPSYDGTCLLNTLPIVGLKEYQNNVLNALTLSKSKASEALDECYIEGIVLKNSSIIIKTERELTDEEIDILNIYVEPLEYYGDSLNFNVKDNRYGFDKGKIEYENILKGIGKYQIKSSSYDKIVLVKNNVYYGGLPRINKIELVLLKDKVYNDDGYRVSGGDAFYTIYKKEVDISLVEINDNVYEENKRYNFNQEVNGNILSLYVINEEEKIGILYSTKRVSIQTKENIDVNDYSLVKIIEYIKLE